MKNFKNKKSKLENINSNNKIKELDVETLKKIEGGIAPALIFAGAILFVGSTSLGFAIGCRIWK